MIHPPSRSVEATASCQPSREGGEIAEAGQGPPPRPEGDLRFSWRLLYVFLSVRDGKNEPCQKLSVPWGKSCLSRCSAEVPQR